MACLVAAASALGGCQDERTMEAWTAHPDLQPGDERTALVQRLDQYRAIATAALIDLEWDDAYDDRGNRQALGMGRGPLVPGPAARR